MPPGCVHAILSSTRAATRSHLQQSHVTWRKQISKSAVKRVEGVGLEAVCPCRVFPTPRPHHPGCGRGLSRLYLGLRICRLISLPRHLCNRHCQDHNFPRVESDSQRREVACPKPHSAPRSLRNESCWPWPIRPLARSATWHPCGVAATGLWAGVWTH